MAAAFSDAAQENREDQRPQAQCLPHYVWMSTSQVAGAESRYHPSPHAEWVGSAVSMAQKPRSTERRRGLVLPENLAIQNFKHLGGGCTHL